MAYAPETVQKVRAWLLENFPEATIDSHDIFDSETHLFTIHEGKGRHPQLEISREILEDESADAILGKLKDGDVLERMKRDPTVRVQVFSDGAPHFETRWISCDRRRYHVVRDAKHNVSVFDLADERLRKTPKQMLVLPNSIFVLQDSEWCERIRTWRGDDQ